jgi:hypothetical protein
MFRSNIARLVFLLSVGTIASFAFSVPAEDGPALTPPPAPPAAQEPVLGPAAPLKPAQKTSPKTSQTAPNSPAPAQPIAPGTVIAPSKSDSQNIPPAPPAAPSQLEGLRQFMAPDGSFVLPGGVGAIKPGDDSIGIQINTPDGPLQFAVPRRHRAAQGTDDQNASDGEPRAGAANRRASREFAITSRIFRAGNYPVALRRVTRYLERDPGDADLLQMRAMTNFALGDYAAAYRDAVTALADGDVWDWTTVRSLYRSADEYTTQYRALEDYVSANPNAARPAFLFAYHNLMLGNNEAARREFGHVAVIDPANEAARRLSTGERPLQPGHPAPATPPAASKTPLPVPQGTTGGGPGVDLGEPAPLAPANKPK